MCNVQTKILAVALFAAFTVSCSNSGDSEKAGQMFSSATEAYESGRPEATIALLDSIDKKFPGEVDLRRKGMHLRAKAQERLTVTELEHTDSLLATLQLENQQLAGNLKKVDNPIEPYYVAAGFTPAPTGIEARMSPDGVVYLVSSLSGHAVKHCQVSASNGSGSASTARVSPDGERCEWSGKEETVHFIGAECDSLIRFITLSETPVTVTWSGKGTYSRPLTVGEKTAIGNVGRYAATVTAIKVASLEHERLEKKLETVRSQIARTYNEEETSQSGK